MANLYYKTSAFFNKPSNVTNAQIAAQAYITFSGRNQQVDINYWSAQIANGLPRERVGWYIKFDNGPDPEAILRPGSPSSSPVPQRNNLILEEVGDVAALVANELAADSDTWYLKFLNSNPSHNPPYSAGDAVFSQSTNVNPFIHMDTAVESYREHFKTRFLLYWNALDEADRPGFLWMDNGRDNPFFTGTSMIQTEQYPEADGSGWWTAAKAWVNWVIDEICIPYEIGLVINLQNTGSSLVRWTEMIDVLARLTASGLPARVFIEFFALTSGGNYQTTLNLWKMSVLKMQIAEGRGVACDCCVQIQGNVMDANSDANEMAKAGLALATWLLGMGSQSTIRYSKDNVSPGYGYFSRPPIFNTYAGIRQPIGKWFENGSASILRRNFVGGRYVEVNYTNPAAPTFTINMTGTGTLAPLVTQTEPPVGWKAGTPAFKQIFAEAQDGGTLTYTLQSGTLPSPMTVNASTGAISGTPASSGSGTATIRVSESGGGSVDTTFTWDVAPGDPVPTPGMIIGLAFGSAVDLTMVNGDVFKAASAAILTGNTGVGFTCTSPNGVTDTTTAAGLALDASVPDHITTALYTQGINDATNPGPIITIPGITADLVTVQIGYLVGGTPTGRIVDYLLQSNVEGTIDFGTGHDLNTCYMVEFTDIDTSSGSLTFQMNRGTGASQSSRAMWLRVIANQPPVWTPLGNRSITIGGSDLVVALEAVDPEGNPITLSLASVAPAFPGDWTTDVDDNGDGTGTLTISPGATSQQTYVVTLEADDGDTAATEDFTLNVFSLPSIDPISDFEVKAGQTEDVELVANSPSSTPALSLSVTVTGQNDAWVNRFVTVETEDGYTYTLHFHPEADQQGVHEVGAVWTDETGNQADVDFTVTVTGLIAIVDVQRNSTGNSVGAALTITTNDFTRLNVYVDDNRTLTALTIEGDGIEAFSSAQLLGGITPQIAGRITLGPATSDVGVYNAVITVTNEDDDSDTWDLEVTVEEEPDPPDEDIKDWKRFALMDVKIKKRQPPRRRAQRRR